MLSEAQWVGQLLKATRTDYGGWGLRLSAMQRFGAPDLVLQLPGYPAVMVETKVAHYAGIEQTGGRITIETTPLQKETLRQIQQAGGVAAVWVLLNDKLVLVCTDPLLEYLQIGQCESMMKERGRAWPIAALIHRTLPSSQRLIPLGRAGL